MQQSPIPILMYHSIAKMPKGTIMRNLHVPPKLFRLQMWLLKILGYKGLNLTQLLHYITATILLEKYLLMDVKKLPITHGIRPLRIQLQHTKNYYN
jgi:hypothetical protein